MTSMKAITGALVFDGESWQVGSALLIDRNKVVGLAPCSEVPTHAHLVKVDGRLLAPGFIDLQVNGGGGVLLNENPTMAGIETICSSHAKFGTTSLLPTLITDTRDVTMRALAAGVAARQRAVPGYLGLHMEGPHLSLEKRGAHDANLIRLMNSDDLAQLLAHADEVGVLLTTIAPENVTQEQVSRLSEGGVIISLGHTNASYETSIRYAEAGATLVTHLFNAMSALGNREPGLVGATLDLGSLSSGIIVDGVHVDPASLRVAIRAKRRPGHLFVVTDAMSTIGTDMKSFTLNGRRINRDNGRLTLSDGTLAGADIDMISSVRQLRSTSGLPLEDVLKMASLYPAEAVGVSDRKGFLKEGYDADFVVLTPELDLESTWIAGNCVHRSGSV